MKKISCLLLMFILPILMVTGCSSDNGNDDDKQIELPNKSEETQMGYADDETSGGFTFTAKSAWTATIAESASSKSSLSWLRLLNEGIETYSGNAGVFRLTVEMSANYTGETRSATITIRSGNDSITITVTQDGKTQDGEVPTGEDNEEPENKVAKRLVSINFESEDNYSRNTATYTLEYDAQGRISTYESNGVEIQKSDNNRQGQFATGFYRYNQGDGVPDEVEFGFNSNRGEYTGSGNGKFDSQGLITNYTYQDAEKGEDPILKSLAITYSDGYVSQISRVYHYDGAVPASYELVWNDGFLSEMTYHLNEDRKQISTKLYKGALKSGKVEGVDINSFLYQGEWLGTMDPCDLMLFGMCGKMNDYLIDRLIVYPYDEREGQAAYYYSYEFDADGDVTKCTITTGANASTAVEHAVWAFGYEVR